MFLLCIVLRFVQAVFALFSKSNKSHGCPRKAAAQSNQFEFGRTRKKPAWVTEEIIKIKALMPAASCRLIALVFNQRFQKRESVGKTYVSYTLRQHLYEIQILRRKIKSRPAYPIPFNKVWGMDLTFVDQQPILGIIEHHSRKSMGLVPLRQKTSVAILQAILTLLESAPAPQFIRTDNEACFNSRLLKFAFWVLGIGHQTIDKHCPWQNGRVERFFGTLKSVLSSLPSEANSDTPYLIHSFEFWYNHIRMHQNIGGQTPEAVYRQAIRAMHKPPDG